MSSMEEGAVVITMVLFGMHLFLLVGSNMALNDSEFQKLTQGWIPSGMQNPSESGIDTSDLNVFERQTADWIAKSGSPSNPPSFFDYMVITWNKLTQIVYIMLFGYAIVLSQSGVPSYLVWLVMMVMTAFQLIFFANIFSRIMGVIRI